MKVEIECNTPDCIFNKDYECTRTEIHIFGEDCQSCLYDDEEENS